METKQLLIGGRGVEFQHFANRVIEGLMIGAPTTASSQATGANGAIGVRVNIDKGLLACGSLVKEYTAQADFVMHSGSGTIQVNEAIVIDLVAYVSKGNNTIYLKAFTGAAAIAASAEAPTDSMIEAYFAADTQWQRIARTKVTRTADTTLTQTYDNTVRNTLVPGTVHYGTNPLA